MFSLVLTSIDEAIKVDIKSAPVYILDSESKKQKLFFTSVIP